MDLTMWLILGLLGLLGLTLVVSIILAIIDTKHARENDRIMAEADERVYKEYFPDGERLTLHQVELASMKYAIERYGANSAKVLEISFNDKQNLPIYLVELKLFITCEAEDDTNVTTSLRIDPNKCRIGPDDF